MDPAGFELALETSRREASLALGVGADVFSVSLGERAHASDLLPRLEHLLTTAGIDRRSKGLPLRALFVGLGPGSYTGLRVGLATALGLARASGARLYGLSSFEALAFAELAVGEEGVVALDARASRFYYGRFRRSPSGLEVLDAPALCTPAELVERCAGAPAILAHPGLAEAAGLAFAPPTRFVVEARPRAEALLALGRLRLAAGELEPERTLEPLYLASFGRPA